MTPMNIAIAGAGGRMGRILIEAVQNADDARLSGALETRLPTTRWARRSALTRNNKDLTA